MLFNNPDSIPFREPVDVKEHPVNKLLIQMCLFHVSIKIIEI